MKKLLALFALMMVTLMGFAYAQEVVVADQTASFDEFFALLFQSIGQFKGASSMVVVALVAQLVMKLIQTKAGDLLGKYKLLTVSLLTLVLGVTGLMSAGGLSLTAALLHSTTLAAIQVFAHQIYKQFIEKQD